MHDIGEVSRLEGVSYVFIYWLIEVGDVIWICGRIVIALAKVKQDTRRAFAVARLNGMASVVAEGMRSSHSECGD